MRKIFAIAATLAVLAGCKSAADKASDRMMPAVERLAAAVPAEDPKAFVRTSAGCTDKLAALEQEATAAPHPPPGTRAALELAPALAWIEAARAETTALEASFDAVLGGVDHDAHESLANAVLGGPTKPTDEMAASIASSPVRPILLWHGSGAHHGFDEDQQWLPPDRRAVDPSLRFIVGYVERVNGDGVTMAVEGLIAERKVAFVTFFEVPSKRRLGVYAVKGETGKVPSPLPPPGTTLPGEKPPLIETLLPKP